MPEWRLNLGSGSDPRSEEEGWLNMDIRRLPGVSVQADIRALPFKDSQFVFVLAEDVVEHVSRQYVLTVFCEIWRVLKPNGTAEIKMPNIDRIITKYVNKQIDANELVRLLWGQADYDENVHQVGATPELIADVLDFVGIPRSSYHIRRWLLGSEGNNMLITLRRS